MKKRIIAFLLMTIMLMSSMTNVMAVSFSDLDSGHWAYEYITTLADQGVINGYTDGTFRPQGTITRGEFYKLIAVASEGERFFEMLAPFYSTWYGPYMGWSSTEGLTMDGLNIETANEPITRLEMGVVLSKYAIYKNIEVDYLNETEIKFTDINELNETQKFYIEYAANIELVTGYEDGSFKPEKNMTRAEAATIIYRFSSRI